MLNFTFKSFLNRLEIIFLDKKSAGELLRNNFNRDSLSDTMEQLKRTPVGLDMMLGRVVPYGIAFHHAGQILEVYT